MKAVVYHEFNGPILIESVPDPEPAPDGAVIEVEATNESAGHHEGVCVAPLPLDGGRRGGQVGARAPEQTVTPAICCGLGGMNFSVYRGRLGCFDPGRVEGRQIIDRRPGTRPLIENARFVD